MSKSDPPDAAGVIRMVDGPDVIRKKIRRAVTDSEAVVRYDPENKPGVSNLLDILAALTGEDPRVVADTMTGYGRLKDAVADAVIADLGPIRTRHDEFLADPSELERALEAGASTAREAAEPLLLAAYRAMGVAP